MKALIVAVLFNYAVIAQVSIPAQFSDNMVLQQQKPVLVWGKGVPGNQVIVSLGSYQTNVTVASDSCWIAGLPAHQAGSQAYNMTIHSGTQMLELKNILFGDIWVCTGQSNMEFPAEKDLFWGNEKFKAPEPQIRFLNPVPAGKNIYGKPYPDSLIHRMNASSFYEWKNWQICSPLTAGSMSAVAYYFAKKVYQETGVPIGMINLSIGGAPLETFISTEALAAHDIFRQKVKGNWLNNSALPVWVRSRAQQHINGNPDFPTDESGPQHPYKPGFVFEAGIRPLLQMAVKGILCYQGESNAQEPERVQEYAMLGKLMVDDWRIRWKQPEMPFYYVQLSSIDTLQYRSQLWPLFRDEQRKMLALIPYSGMAVSSDLGAKNDVHPANKKDIGERLAAWALNKTYHQKISYSGPVPLTAIYKKGKVIVTFKYTRSGLQTKDDQPVQGFSTDGIHQVPVLIRKKRVIVRARMMPEYIYYGWTAYSEGNLLNSSKLPAVTFRLNVK
ncbi:MAG: sialate O-acetylesterase [Chitinophagaceae bacterium]|nr:sialate O-acetylesterase [Chitinophagaceae bacterium]